MSLPWIMTDLIYSNLKIQVLQLKLKGVFIFYSWIHVRCLGETLAPLSAPLNGSMSSLLSLKEMCCSLPPVSGYKDSSDMVFTT